MREQMERRIENLPPASFRLLLPLHGRASQRLTWPAAVLLAVLALPAVAQREVREIIVTPNRNGDTVSVVDAASMTTLATIPVGANPHEAATSADGRFAFVTNYANSFGFELSVIDLDALREVRRIHIGTLRGPHGIVEKAGRIWFTAERTQNAGRYDPFTDRIDWVGATLQSGSHMLAVTADASTVYTANIGSASVSVIPVGTGETAQAATIIPVVVEPEGIALSPDGREVWAGSRGPFGISVIDTATNRVTATLETGKPAYRLAFSPDGLHVVAPRERRVTIYNATTRTIVREIDTTGFALSVVFASDSRRLFIATSQPDRILRADITTGEITGSVAAGPTPDGIALAVQRRGGARRRAVGR